MPKSKTVAKIRVSIDLTEAFYERLTALEELIEADSKADVIRYSINAMEYLAKMTAKGRKFYVTDENGKPQRIVFFGLQCAEDDGTTPMLDGRPCRATTRDQGWSI